jgi:hypothetical protein
MIISVVLEMMDVIMSHVNDNNCCCLGDDGFGESKGVNVNLSSLLKEIENQEDNNIMQVLLFIQFWITS